MTNGSPWLALIALDEERLPEAEAVTVALCEHFDGECSLVETSRSPRGVTFQSGAATGNYTLVDQPIPWSRLEGPCATAWYWPEAEATLRPHTSHLFLTLLDEAASPIDTAIRLTRIAAALALTSGGTGLVWGPSGQVHRPEDFAGLAAKILLDDLPLHLWVDFRVTQREDGDLTLFTTGLEAVGRHEFEVPRYQGDAHQLAGTVYNIAHYVMEKGPVLKDGEAVGLPDGGQVTVQLGASMIDPSQEVIQLLFE